MNFRNYFNKVTISLNSEYNFSIIEFFFSFIWWKISILRLCHCSFDSIDIYIFKNLIEILFLFSMYPIFSLMFTGCKNVFSSSVFLSFMRSSLNGTRFRFGIQNSRAFFHLLMFSTFVCRKIEAVWKCSAVMRPEKFPRLGCFANCTSLLYIVFVYSYRLYCFFCLYRVTVAFSLLT